MGDGSRSPQVGGGVGGGRKKKQGKRFLGIKKGFFQSRRWVSLFLISNQKIKKKRKEKGKSGRPQTITRMSSFIGSG
jgi:hypothetical protein